MAVSESLPAIFSGAECVAFIRGDNTQRIVLSILQREGGVTVAAIYVILYVFPSVVSRKEWDRRALSAVPASCFWLDLVEHRFCMGYLTGVVEPRECGKVAVLLIVREMAGRAVGISTVRDFDDENSCLAGRRAGLCRSHCLDMRKIVREKGMELE